MHVVIPLSVGGTDVDVGVMVRVVFNILRCVVTALSIATED